MKKAFVIVGCLVGVALLLAIVTGTATALTRLVFYGATSGSTTLEAPDVAGGTIRLPPLQNGAVADLVTSNTKIEVEAPLTGGGYLQGASIKIGIDKSQIPVDLSADYAWTGKQDFSGSKSTILPGGEELPDLPCSENAVFIKTDDNLGQVMYTCHFGAWVLVGGEAFYAKPQPGLISGSPSQVFDCSKGSMFRMTLAVNISSSSVVNCVDGQVLTFVLSQPAGTNYTFAWPSNMKCVNGTCPPATAINGKTDTLTCAYSGGYCWELSRTQNLG